MLVNTNIMADVYDDTPYLITSYNSISHRERIIGMKGTRSKQTRFCTTNKYKNKKIAQPTNIVNIKKKRTENKFPACDCFETTTKPVTAQTDRNKFCATGINVAFTFG